MRVLIGLAASDGIGEGAESGISWLDHVADSLRASGEELEFFNLSLSGAVLGPSVRKLVGSKATQSVVEDELPSLPEIKDPLAKITILLFCVVNDLNFLSMAWRSINQGVIAYHADGMSLLMALRKRYPQAEILVLNSPNIGRMPYAQTLLGLAQRALTKYAKTINTMIESWGVRVVNLFDDPRVADPENFASDGLHLSDRGHQRLALLVDAALRSQGEYLRSSL